jgi:DnaJ-domain-containing protein 1
MAKTRTSSRFARDIRIKPDTKAVAEAAVKVHACAVAGCKHEGAYRVPKSREELSKHIWLCLSHARAHNESWDFFAGMSERQIENFRNDAIIGHRPTWPLGKRAARMHNPFGNFHFEDQFAVAGEAAETAHPRRPERQVTRLQLTAFDVLGLEPSATLIEIKARYKELVKRFHPDANGGDRGAEERLKQVIKAYGVLRASGLT